jgi:serine/threonine protein kinase
MVANRRSSQYSAAVNTQTNEGVAVKKVTNVFSKKILAKRALREIKLLQHFRGHRNVSIPTVVPMTEKEKNSPRDRSHACTIWIFLDRITSTKPIFMRVGE